jgi:DNA-binding transcriptional LysR family regulator
MSIIRITLHQAEAFFWAARLGSFHAAARHLNLSQPAISSRIREFESTLNVQLFERQNQRIHLTELGRHALIHAERLLAAGQDLERLGVDDTLSGVLRFGADESSALAGLTDILALLRARHPRLLIEVSIDLGVVLRDRVNRRELDVAMHTSHGDKRPAHVVEQVLGWVEFQWLAATTARAFADVLIPADAIGRSIVTNSAPSMLNALVHDWFRSAGYEFTTHTSCNSLSLMMRLVEAGEAIAVLPVTAVREQILANRMRVLVANPPLPVVPFSLSYVSDTRREGIAAVAETVRNVLDAAGYFSRAPSNDGRRDADAPKATPVEATPAGATRR